MIRAVHLDMVFIPPEFSQAMRTLPSCCMNQVIKEFIFHLSMSDLQCCLVCFFVFFVCLELFPERNFHPIHLSDFRDYFSTSHNGKELTIKDTPVMDILHIDSIDSGNVSTRQIDRHSEHHNRSGNAFSIELQFQVVYFDGPSFSEVGVFVSNRVFRITICMNTCKSSCSCTVHIKHQTIHGVHPSPIIEEF